MVKDAEAHAAEDKKRREEIETRNRLDAMVYDVEKNAKEWSDRLEPSLKQRLDEAVDAAQKALRAGDDGRDQEGLGGAAGGLQRGRPVPLPAGAALVRGGRRGAGGAAPGGEAKKPEDVVEADYEIVDDQEKKP